MRNDIVLNISGAVLEEYLLENFLEKLASATCSLEDIPDELEEDED